MAIEPDERQLAEIAADAGGADDRPVVMLNLNRYRECAAYESEALDDDIAEVSGREAYARYGAVATAILDGIGARILWYAQAGQTVIGDDSDRYDEVIAVWYPSRAAFVALATAPEILAARADRNAGLERATLLCCESGAEPMLAGP
jgi:uncharacterized protein (DUF1330 family)